mgnify:CR=1 FL=1
MGVLFKDYIDTYKKYYRLSKKVYSMSKVYNETDTLVGEHLISKIDIHDWIDTQILTEKDPWIYLWMKEAGRYYTTMLETSPKGVPMPSHVEPGQCHHNNAVYANELADLHPELLDDFKFVTGYHGISPKQTIASDKKYAIGRHTFMTYKGAVLDYGILAHPTYPIFVHQYFGISFDLKVVLNAIGRLDSEITEKIPMLDLLRYEPYLKE